MSKTYSEVRQEILFKAARDLFKLAASPLDDTTDQPVPPSMQGAVWARQAAARIAKQADEIEGQGHELSVASTLQNTNLFKAHRVYENAKTRLAARLEADGHFTMSDVDDEIARQSRPIGS